MMRWVCFAYLYVYLDPGECRHLEGRSDGGRESGTKNESCMSIGWLVKGKRGRGMVGCRRM